MENCARMMEDDTPQAHDAEQEPHVREFEPDGELDDSSADKVTALVEEQVNDAFRLYLRDIHRTKLLSATEEKELALKIESGDRAARDRMITSNLRLVVKIAKRYVNQGLPFLDLIEEGNLGLIKAVERFDVSRGFRFSTFATWWIRQGMERAVMNQARSVRLPVHVAEDIGKVSRATYLFRKQTNRDPTLTEIAETLEMDLNHVRKLQVLLLGTCSMDQPLGENSSFCLADTLEDTSNLSPVDQIAGHNAYEIVSDLIKTFPAAERKILTLRFGLDDHEPQTLETIGRSFGLTRERIRQIESASLSKLRKLLGPHDGIMASC
jgi:RNA polymerase primary sigma factor